MVIERTMLLRLKEHGFKWFKDGTTDKVNWRDIADIVPAANGFTVIYDESSVLVMTTAVVARIEDRDYPEEEWIYVHWDSITDQRRE